MVRRHAVQVCSGIKSPKLPGVEVKLLAISHGKGYG